MEPARRSDLESILALLDRSRLPIDGLDGHLDSTLVARADGAVVGCAAVEPYGSAALLRSVAVDPKFRGEGLGQRLTEAALRLARERGAREVYLLTETAAEFFPRFGFQPVDRAAIPDSVKASAELVSACPVSALAMRTSLALTGS